MENLRVSFYTIVIPLENSKNDYMLIHGYTGAIDIVPQHIGEFLMHNDADIKYWNYSHDVLSKLVQRGFITEKNVDEEITFVSKIADALHLYQKSNYKKFYFIVNYNCNFRCPYCYENLASGKGKTWSHQIMTKEIVDMAFDSLMKIEPNKNKHNKEIVLYGGEPLMDENLEIVRYIVEKGTSLGYCFSAITNGYDLNYFVSLLGPELIKKIQITLDGYRSYHNKRRFHYKKGASFDKIIENIQLALHKGVQVIIRSNVDDFNVESIKELLLYFKRLDLYDNPLFTFYPAMLKNNLNSVLDVTKNANISFIKSSIEFEDINDEFRNNVGAYSGLILYALKNKKPLRLCPTYCGAQTGLYILDPNYDIYCCLESVGLPQYVIGNYKNKLEWNTTYSAWKERTTTSIPKCKKCKYSLICGGGCVAKIMHKGLNKPYCDSFSDVFRANARRAYIELTHV